MLWPKKSGLIVVRFLPWRAETGDGGEWRNVVNIHLSSWPNRTKCRSCKFLFSFRRGSWVWSGLRITSYFFMDLLAKWLTTFKEKQIFIVTTSIIFISSLLWVLYKMNNPGLSPKIFIEIDWPLNFSRALRWWILSFADDHWVFIISLSCQTPTKHLKHWQRLCPLTT